MVQCVVGESDEDNRLDLVIEEYAEQFLSRVALRSYAQYTLKKYSSKLTFPVPGGLVGSSARFSGNSDNTHP
jgi:hypothetical protein